MKLNTHGLRPFVLNISLYYSFCTDNSWWNFKCKLFFCSAIPTEGVWYLIRFIMSCIGIWKIQLFEFFRCFYVYVNKVIELNFPPRQSNSLSLVSNRVDKNLKITLDKKVNVNSILSITVVPPNSRLIGSSWKASRISRLNNSSKPFLQKLR